MLTNTDIHTHTEKMEMHSSGPCWFSDQIDFNYECCNATIARHTLLKKNGINSQLPRAVHPHLSKNSSTSSLSALQSGDLSAHIPWKHPLSDLKCAASVWDFISPTLPLAPLLSLVPLSRWGDPRSGQTWQFSSYVLFFCHVIDFQTASCLF